jgi:transposase InsO family protein
MRPPTAGPRLCWLKISTTDYPSRTSQKAFGFSIRSPLVRSLGQSRQKLERSAPHLQTRHAPPLASPGFSLVLKIQIPLPWRSPKLSTETVALIQRMAQENRPWGTERIRSELLKLGIAVAKYTLQKYIARVRPVKPTSQTWSMFLKKHAKDIRDCDFLPVIDRWFRPLYLFFIIELASRRAIHFGVTQSPTDAWVAQQLREATPFGQAPRFLIRDRGSKFGQAFTRVAVGSSIEVLKTPHRAPKANAICERFLGSARRRASVSNHVLVLGEQHLYRVIRDYVEYFNRARPHQGIGQKIPERIQSEKCTGKIIALPVLNGLHHDYRRAT